MTSGRHAGQFVYPSVGVYGTVAEWAWVWDDTGELNSPIFNSEQEARDWIDERTKGQFVVQTSIEQPA